jgi:hypothetical protein
VDDAQYIDAIGSNSPVDHEIRRVGHHKFACSPDAPASAEVWMIDKPICARLNAITLIQSSFRAFLLQVADDILSVVLGCRKPDHDHEAAS